MGRNGEGMIRRQRSMQPITQAWDRSQCRSEDFCVGGGGESIVRGVPDTGVSRRMADLQDRTRGVEVEWEWMMKNSGRVGGGW